MTTKKTKTKTTESKKTNKITKSEKEVLDDFERRMQDAPVAEVEEVVTEYSRGDYDTAMNIVKVYRQAQHKKNCIAAGKRFKEFVADVDVEVAGSIYFSLVNSGILEGVHSPKDDEEANAK